MQQRMAGALTIASNRSMRLNGNVSRVSGRSSLLAAPVRGIRQVCTQHRPTPYGMPVSGIPVRSLSIRTRLIDTIKLFLFAADRFSPPPSSPLSHPCLVSLQVVQSALWHPLITAPASLRVLVRCFTAVKPASPRGSRLLRQRWQEGRRRCIRRAAAGGFRRAISLGRHHCSGASSGRLDRRHSQAPRQPQLLVRVPSSKPENSRVRTSGMMLLFPYLDIGD